MHAAAVLAVLPEYRRSFVEALQASFDRSGDKLTLVAGDVHSDPTVKSADFPRVVRVINRHILGRRLLWQAGALHHTRGADVVVIDLNPRSLTSWALLLSAKIRRQRVLAWGHISPRAGRNSSTAPVRRAMRRSVDGVISYTWNDARRVHEEDPREALWVAANGLYPSRELRWTENPGRMRVLYVGRLESSKKPLLALDAFALIVDELPQGARLTFVGSGSLRADLEVQAANREISDRVDFLGHISDLEELRRLYSETLISVSPGYVGLSLTQSLGFGVPMLVADDEPHAPEVELLTKSTGAYFEANSPESLADSLRLVFDGRLIWDPAALLESVKTTYSADAMADGFEKALRGVPQDGDGGG